MDINNKNKHYLGECMKLVVKRGELSYIFIYNH